MARPFMFAALCQRAYALKHSLAESKNSEKIFVSRGITVYTDDITIFVDIFQFWLKLSKNNTLHGDRRMFVSTCVINVLLITRVTNILVLNSITVVTGGTVVTLLLWLNWFSKLPVLWFCYCARTVLICGYILSCVLSVFLSTLLQSMKREKPTRCNNQMFIINFCLNMFRVSLCPSSGEQRTCYCIWCVLVWFCWMQLVAVVGRCVVGCEHYEVFC